MLIFAMTMMLTQDVAWADMTHAAGRQSGVTFAGDLTGAQTDTCFEVLERLGAAQATRARLADRVGMLDRAIAAEESIDRDPAAEAMRQQALVIARRYRDDMTELAAENARDLHALGSVTLSVCRPVLPTP